MDVRFLLGLSVILQLAAAGVALAMIRVTGKRLAWTLIAFAISLMAVRRGISLYRFESGDLAHTPDLYAELVALTISILMLGGLALIAPVFRAVRRSAETLRASEQRYRLLVEATRVIPWEADAATWQFSYVGPQAAQLFGYPLEAWYEKDFWVEHLHPDDRDAAVRFCAQQTAEGRNHEFEYRMVKADGEIVWIRDLVTVELDGGRPSVLRGVLVDITEQRRTTEALRESEQHMQHLLAVSPAVIYSCGPGPDYPTTYISENVHAQLGYEPGEFLADPSFWTKLLHPEDAQHVADELAQIESEGNLSYEYRFRHKNGRYVWLHDELSAVRDSSGRVIRLVGSWFDVTERRQAKDALQAAHDELEERVRARTAELVEANRRLRLEIEERKRIGIALGESEARQRVILQSIPMATYVRTVPPELKATWVSEQVEQICGYPPDRFVNQPGFWRERIHPDDRDLVVTRLGSLVEDVAVENEYRWKCADDRYRWFLDRAVLHRAGDGQPREVIGTWLDISQRKHAEQELRDSSATMARLLEEQYALLEHTRDFVYRHDAEGVFNYLSPAVEQVTGYSVAEWWKHYTAYLTDNPLNQKVIEYTERALRTGKETPPYLVEIAHKKGYPVTLEVNERPYFEGGNVAGIVGVARDVTDRVRAQKELQKAKEAAETANRAKSVFLANVSHEIRTPLTAMLGAAELLAAEPTGGGKQGTQADMIIRNGRHLLALIDDLLDLSRAEAGRLEIERVPVVLPDLMADVRAVIEPLHRRFDVDFQIRYATPIPIPIQTDPTRFKQALINLIGNALKFTHSGHVSVNISVHREAKEPRLWVTVEDTGCGIPRADAERIFGKFSQLGPAAKGVADGVGLGLPLARYIAQHLGGSVTVKSQEHVGSIFTLRIATGPLDDVTWSHLEDVALAPQGPDRGTGRQAQATLTGTILLADDFTDTRNLIEEVLASRGATVTAVANGEAAVEAATAQTFDLILMDIRMPVMDGLEATAELRRRRCLTPIIALTASTSEGDRRRILDAGFDDLWAKPLTLDHLISEVAAYIGTGPGACERDGSNVTAPNVSLDNPRLKAVRAEFVRHLPERLAYVRAAVETGDMRRARETLHQLVGSGGTHGFMSISHEAARLLSLAKRGGLAANTDELGELDQLVRQAHASTFAQEPGHPTSPSASA